MLTKSSMRPVGSNKGVAHTGLNIIRILIASYFMAGAAAAYLNPTGPVLLGGLLAPGLALSVSTVWVFVAGLALMTGIAVRPAALLLAVNVLTLGYVDMLHTGAAAYLGDMGLLGALLLVSLAAPGGSLRFRKGAKALTPRRVVSSNPGATARPAGFAHQVTRNGVVVADDDTEVDNIFADLWDRPAVKSLA